MIVSVRCARKQLVEVCTLLERDLRVTSWRVTQYNGAASRRLNGDTGDVKTIQIGVIRRPRYVHCMLAGFRLSTG